MQLVGVARLGPGLGHDARDGVRVEGAEVALVLGERAPQRHRARAALLERRVVEERVRLRVEDLVRERRRLGRVARVQADLAALDALEHVAQPVGVHRLDEAVAHASARTSG